MEKVNYSKQNIVINDVSFSYIECGNGEPCLCLHGSRDRKDYFDGIMKIMSDKYHLIAIDFRGHGDTEKTDKGYNFPQFVNDIVIFLQKKKIKQINLIGHSLGGVISLLLAYKYPYIVKKIVLIGSVISFSAQFRRPKVNERISQKDIEETNKNAFPYFFMREYKDIAQQVLDNWSQIPPHVHESLIRMGHFDLDSVVSSIRHKILLIYGDEDKISSKEARFEMLSKLKNSTIKSINNAGHFVFMEKPIEVSKLILNFFSNEKGCSNFNK